ncbi:lig_chan-Glu_bd domain-containing protein [Trichonephila clavipes]|uniref:Lig_chan-Glu_bd domain-containing protein n=1 Tax=Trichonephila clavipes TaxID=2585209 RepID=A0A8X6V7B2_TRICX|nr:lig_chan-Glu_bd domain-containing protein [Trichonephila clavipes]
MNATYSQRTMSLIRVAVVPLRLIMNITAGKDGRVMLSGADGLFMNTILKALKFQYEYYIPPDREWGTLLNGSWTGMIGALVNNKADLAWGWITQNEDRQAAIDFSTSYYRTAITFGVVKPSPVPVANAVAYPFTLSVWACIFILLITVPAIFLLLKVHHSYLRLLLHLFGSILKQPLNFEQKSVKDKILVLTWLLFTTLISSFYSSLLLSFLTMPLEQRTIQTFRELSNALQKGKVECYTSRQGLLLPYLQNSNEEYLRFIGKVIEEKEWFTDVHTKGLAITTNKNVAIINSALFLQRKNGIPDSRPLVISDEALFLDSIAVAMRKDFCCKRRLNTMITRAIEAGLFDFYLRSSHRWLLSKRAEKRALKMLTIWDITSACFIFALGLSLSVLSLFLELYCGKWRKASFSNRNSKDALFSEAYRIISRVLKNDKEEKRLTNSNLIKFTVKFLKIVYPQTYLYSEEFGTVIEDDDDDTNAESEKELSL